MQRAAPAVMVVLVVLGMWGICQLLGAANAQTAHPATSSTAPAHQRLGSANAETTPEHRPQRPSERSDQRNMRRDERVTVQGPVKEQQPDGMSHTGGGGAVGAAGRCAVLISPQPRVDWGVPRGRGASAVCRTDALSSDASWQILLLCVDQTSDHRTHVPPLPSRLLQRKAPLPRH